MKTINQRLYKKCTIEECTKWYNETSFTEGVRVLASSEKRVYTDDGLPTNKFECSLFVETRLSEQNAQCVQEACSVPAEVEAQIDQYDKTVEQQPDDDIF